MESITAFVFAAMTLLVASAPTYKEPIMNNEKEDVLRDKRSQYGVQYLSPCAAANAQMPSYAPYHIDMAPMHAGFPHYGYTGPHYRSIDPTDEQEILGFSDMDHMSDHIIPMARYGTFTVPSHAGAIGPAVIPSNPNLIHPNNPTPAFGVFQNSNTGGCNVPLLFSCTPSIVQGQIVKAQSNYGYSQPADTYRGVDDHMSHHEESGSHEHSAIINDSYHPSLQ